ncbi:MAG TPA: DUF5718 family protein [Solirubrobacterales bacterium]|jgi:hypothetical protein|nr:DUF5718 family protein [Solirubrobacterales bacterium]
MPSAASAPGFELDLTLLRSWFGVGVAGNFAGHLEQAGEAGDFRDVEAAADAPKGIFPFYAPGLDSYLSTYPLSHDEVAMPAAGSPTGNLQIEPEVALACRVDYGDDGAVAALVPLAFGAFNDCSVRRADAAKLSEKKNWGACSKGVAASFIPLGDASLEQASASHRLASFLRRDGELHAYGVDSPLSGYSYFGERLLDWVVERLNNQEGGPESPLEPVGHYLGQCGRPARMLLAIGATRYTAFGESTYLRLGDEAIVVVYDGESVTPAGVEAALRESSSPALAGASSLLAQRVRD